MTNTKLKRKAKQIAVLVEMGIVSINEVKRKVKPQFYRDYVLPLLEERYIPLTYLRIYGGIGDLIKVDIASALVDIDNYSAAAEWNDFKILANLRNLLKGTKITADQLQQEMFEKYMKAQQKIKYYSKAYPIAVKVLELSIDERLKTFSKFVPEPKPSGATKLYNLIKGVKL